MSKNSILNILLVSAIFVASTGMAQDLAGSKTANAGVVTLQTVAVSGVQPAPRMWRVSKGNHILWIIGTLSPVPKDLAWNTRYVESSMLRAQEFIQAPQARIKMGLFKKVSLLRAVYKAGKNPDDSDLSSILPPEMYLRWQKLWSMYGDGDTAMDKYRPNFARSELYRAAVKKAGLVGNEESVTKALIHLANEHDLKIVEPMLELNIPDAKNYLVGQMKASDPGFACFGATLDLVQHDLDKMRNRAIEWSTGDVEQLQKIKLPNRFSCEERYRAANDGTYHTGNIDRRLKSLWLSIAEKALNENKVTVAELPLSRILGSDGCLSSLKEHGYSVDTARY